MSLRGLITSIVMPLIGGFPLKVVPTVTGAGLPLTQSLFGGGALAGIAGGVLGGGLGQIFQNPIETLTGGLTPLLGQAAGDLTSALGADASGLVGALTGAAGLQGSLGKLADATNLLSGAALPTLAGQFGLSDVLGHAKLVEGLGAALPAGLSLEAALGPMRTAGQLGAVATALPGLVAGVIDGSLPIGDAVAQVSGWSSALDAVLDASQAALGGLQAGAPAMAVVNVVAHQLAGLSGAPAPIQELLGAVIKPDVRAAMEAALAPPSDPVAPVAPTT